MKIFLLAFVLLALASSFASAFDSSPLQDFYVAIDDPLHVFANGKFCKNPKLAKAEDFFFSVKNPGNTDNQVGSNFTDTNVEQIAGLNTLGISAVRIDYAPYGQNAPHTHPRATEILVVWRVLFLLVLSHPTLITSFSHQVLNPGDVFVFPIGLFHFQFNIGNTNGIASAALSSQNPGVITITNAVFGSDPAIDPYILARAFQLDVIVVKDL